MILHATSNINNVGKSLLRKVISLLSISVICTLGAGYCMSASLGDIQIRSMVGQPLLATIETTLESPLPMDQIVARIASAEKHQEFNVPFDAYLNA